MIHNDTAGIAAYIIASLSLGIIAYILGMMMATDAADKKIANMRREYMDALNTLYHKFSAQMSSPMSPPRSSAKPRPHLHIFRNEDKKDDKPLR
jgi:hypothetical protein